MQTSQTYDRIMVFVLTTLEEFKTEEEISWEVNVDADVSLVGDNAVIDSRSLVQLLIAVEDFVDEEFHANFDWTSDRAMSQKHSPFRTPRTITELALEGVES